LFSFGVNFAMIIFSKISNKANRTNFTGISNIVSIRLNNTHIYILGEM
jgi:hypothetical protein